MTNSINKSPYEKHMDEVEKHAEDIKELNRILMIPKMEWTTDEELEGA